MMAVEFSCSSVDEYKESTPLMYTPNDGKFVRNLFEFGFFVYEIQNENKYFSHFSLNEDEKLELYDGTFSKSQRIRDIVSLFSESDYDGIVIEFRNGESFHIIPKCEENYMDSDLMVQCFLKLMLNQREDPCYIKDKCKDLACINYEVVKEKLKNSLSTKLDREIFKSNDKQGYSEYQQSSKSVTDVIRSFESNSPMIITPRNDKYEIKESVSRCSSTKSQQPYQIRRPSLNILKNYVWHLNQNGSSKSTVNSCSSSPSPEKLNFVSESYKSNVSIKSPKSIFSVFETLSISFKSSSSKSSPHDSNLPKLTLSSSSVKVTAIESAQSTLSLK